MVGSETATTPAGDIQNNAGGVGDEGRAFGSVAERRAASLGWSSGSVQADAVRRRLTPRRNLLARAYSAGCKFLV